MPSDWTSFKKELEEKGYLQTQKGGFFFRWSLKSLTPGGSLVRLALWTSIMTAGALSFMLAALFLITQRVFLPQILIYYFPLLVIASLAVFALLTVVLRLHPFRTPTRAAAAFALLAAAGGVRHVRVRIKSSSPLCEQITVLGHELRHAAEIAASPPVGHRPAAPIATTLTVRARTWA